MGFWDFLRRPYGGWSSAHLTPNVTHLGPEELHAMLLGDLTPAQMWATQPHLRTVVSFLARNVAQLGLHSFVRTGESRERDRDSVFARTMRRPNADMTAYDLIFALVGDMALYDRAYWLLAGDPEGPAGIQIRRLPPAWVQPIPRDVFGFGSYLVLNGEGRQVEVPASEILAFTGYHPESPRKGSPAVEALKETLSEQIEAARYRGQVWKRGGRVSAVLQRPAEAPKWSDAARDRFREDWYAKFTGRGKGAGGTPILEDGMTLQRIDFNAQEQQFVEAAKLAFSTVASVFHVNPTMVGILDDANYSNVREFRRMLYGDTLGPLIAQIEDRVNTFLLPRLDMDNSRFYAEFNIAEKLQGSFEEQAAVMSTLVGRPIMTADEARPRFNLPQLGGDAAQLVTPLNVLIGDQASPRDTGSQNVVDGDRIDEPKQLSKGRRRSVKVRPSAAHEKRVRQVLESFFARQRSSVLSALGAKSPDWWDEDRWNRELSQDLTKLALLITEHVGRKTLSQLGVDPEDYDPDQTVKFLKAVSERIAGQINTATWTAIEEAIAEDDDAAAAAGEVFDDAKTHRAETAAVTAVTTFSAFATQEAAHQVSGGNATKTWLVTSGSPRAAHAAMDGETVPLDDTFSNGAMWPGDAMNLDVDDVAGCQCDLQINLPA